MTKQELAEALARQTNKKINLVIITVAVTLALTFIAEAACFKIYDQSHRIARLESSGKTTFEALKNFENRFERCQAAVEQLTGAPYKPTPTPLPAGAN